jgi:hypothetical protein
MQALSPRYTLGSYPLAPSPRARVGSTLHRRTRPHRGMGASVSPTQITQAATSATSAVLVATTPIAASVGTALGISAAAAIPIVGAAIAAIGFAIDAILNSGCGNTCIITSDWANQAEAQLQQNIAAYFAIPTPRPLSAQQAALGNFLAVWNYLVSQCSNPQLGAAGQACITDRQAGACHWKQPASSVPPWGTPPAGACWNWWNGYHDPIANDPDVYNDGGVLTGTAASAATSASTAVSGALSSLTTATGLSATTLILLAAGALILLGSGA